MGCTTHFKRIRTSCFRSYIRLTCVPAQLSVDSEEQRTMSLHIQFLRSHNSLNRFIYEGAKIHSLYPCTPEILAFYHGRCPLCEGSTIKPGDPITGVTINNQGRSWDCLRKCPLYQKLHPDGPTTEDITEGAICLHESQVYWVHSSCIPTKKVEVEWSNLI